MSFAADLDAFLAEYGQDVILRRIVGTTNPSPSDCTCRAFVRGYAAAELAGGIIQGDSMVILSATDIIRAQWPGGQPVTSPPATIDPRIPRATDKMVIAGRLRSVISAEAIHVDGELVRINAQVRG